MGTSFVGELFNKEVSAVIRKKNRLLMSITTIFSPFPPLHSCSHCILCRGRGTNGRQIFLSQLDIDSIIGFIITM